MAKEVLVVGRRMTKKIYNNLCDKLDKQGTRFAVSNLLVSKGNTNEILQEWSKKYKVHYIDMSYNNSNYQRKSEDRDIEVLITNY